jgi:hypothetical protein
VGIKYKAPYIRFAKKLQWGSHGDDVIDVDDTKGG